MQGGQYLGPNINAPFMAPSQQKPERPVKINAEKKIADSYQIESNRIESVRPKIDFSI